MAKSDLPAGPTADDQPALAVEQGFYQRWSRRKAEYLQLQANAGPRDDVHGHDVHGDAAQVTGGAAATTADTAVDEDAEPCLPPLDSLNEHSDLSEFMGARVAEEIRLLALRKVFHSASFNICDGLDDYAENYRNFEPLGDIITADLRHQLKRLQQIADAAEPQELENENAGQAAESEQSMPIESDHEQQAMASLSSLNDADAAEPPAE